MKKKPSRKAKPSKALTKEQLVKLYEEFKEKDREEYLERLKENYEYSYDSLCDFIDSGRLSFWNWKKEIKNAIKNLDSRRPTYTEPTFDEFMESLGEKKIINVCGDDWSLLRGLFEIDENLYR